MDISCGCADGRIDHLYDKCSLRERQESDAADVAREFLGLSLPGLTAKTVCKKES